jgi:hypothetical protein
MKAPLLNSAGFDSNLTAGNTGPAAGLFKMKKNVMKLKIHFGEQIRFNEPIRRSIRIRAPLFPAIRLSLRALAMTERTKPIRHLID